MLFSTVPNAVIISFTGKGKAPKRPRPSFITSRQVGGTFGYRNDIGYKQIEIVRGMDI